MMFATMMLAAGADALSCAPCDPDGCQPPTGCAGGQVKDVCDCCKVCAKVQGEKCGGPWGISGTCDSGLTCEKPNNDFNVDGVCSGGSGPIPFPPFPIPCLCTMEYTPVCGKDNKDYSNACMAGCANTQVAYQGKCKPIIPPLPKPPCICAMIYKPVCGEDKKTYSNECMASCVGKTTVKYQGKCKTPVECICPAIYKPVCGKNKKTYSNSCMATCVGKTTVKYQGKCKKMCICTMIYQPVCGSNNKTYSNLCVANCARVSIAYNGACQPPPAPTPVPGPTTIIVNPGQGSTGTGGGPAGPSTGAIAGTTGTAPAPGSAASHMLTTAAAIAILCALLS